MKAEPRKTPSKTATTLSAECVDDLVRAVAIIGASANPLPPDPKTLELHYGYSADQHRLAVELCQKVIADHELQRYEATTPAPCSHLETREREGWIECAACGKVLLP